MQEKKEPTVDQTGDSGTDNAAATSTANSSASMDASQLTPTKKVKKQRAFATVIYEDSAASDWESVIRDSHVEAFASPWHDKDVDPDGTVKKKHRHILLLFQNAVSPSRADEIFARIGGVGRETVQSTRGYARYLIHKDNPEKYQYEQSEVIEFGGACYSAVIALPTDTDKALRDIFAYIRDREIYSFADFIDDCAVNNDEWFRLATTQRSYVIDKYIKSHYWRNGGRYVQD